jgi:hypothetical protein
MAASGRNTRPDRAARSRGAEEPNEWHIPFGSGSRWGRILLRKLYEEEQGDQTPHTTLLPLPRLKSVRSNAKRGWTDPLTCGKVASVQNDACFRLAGVAGDERAGDRRRHHHVSNHADAEGQTCGGAD